jgi:hypothetical protein
MAETRYKVGDKVIIDLIGVSHNTKFGITSQMRDYQGGIATVVHSSWSVFWDTGRYLLDIDYNSYIWWDEVLRPFIDPNEVN